MNIALKEVKSEKWSFLPSRISTHLHERYDTESQSQCFSNNADI